MPWLISEGCLMYSTQPTWACSAAANPINCLRTCCMNGFSSYRSALFYSISVRHARACAGRFLHTSVALCSPENAPRACHRTVWWGGSWAECGSLALHSLFSKSLLNQIWGHEEEIYSLSYQCDRMFLVKKRENGPLWAILRGFIV